MKNKSLPASLITMVVGGGCVGAQIVLRFHPKCESTRSAHWTSCLFRPMFHLRRSDAIVVPVPPEALHGRLWGTFIRRYPSSWMQRHARYPPSFGGDGPHAGQILGGGRAVSPAEQAGVPIHPEGRSANRTVAASLAEQ
jgi:hypothetical protein